MKKLLFVFILALSLSILKGQDLGATWSDMTLYTNKTTGFFDDFIGSNSKYVYVKCSKIPAFHIRSRKAGEKKSKINIIAYDKLSMKEVANATIFDLSKDGTKAKYGNLSYYKTIIFENTLYVFWISDEKKKDELYVESYDSKLKKLNALKKIYELSSTKSALRKAELFVMGNQKAGEKIIIGGELSTEEGQNIKMEYKVLNADFSFSAANQVTLPLIASKSMSTNFMRSRGSDNLSSSYTYGDDGNLHLRTSNVIDSDDKKATKNLTALLRAYYGIYSIVDVNTGKIYSFSMKSDDKNILDFHISITKTYVKITGFFNDLNKGGTLNGIFTTTIDPKTYKMSALNYTYFNKDQLAALFAKDKEDANKVGVFASKKKKEEAKNALSSNYTIEEVQTLDKDNLVLFTSKMLNYYKTSTDSKGNMHQTPMCQKDNITAFKINTKGEIVWATNLDRRMTYSGWYIFDVQVINKDKKFYVVYGSGFNSEEKENGKIKKKKKSKDQRTDRLEYAVFDYNTGAVQRKELKINAMNAKKEDIKTVVPRKIEVVDNQFYANSTKGKFKPLPTILSFIGCFICPPVGAIPFIVPSCKKWTGYNGKISAIN